LQGRNSDGGVIENTTSCGKLKSNMLNLPTTEIMEGELNFVGVADDAFKLHKNILNLFSGNPTHD
jgi:hypothetical protein